MVGYHYIEGKLEIDRWMDGWMDGWMGGWMDGWIIKSTSRMENTET